MGDALALRRLFDPVNEPRTDRMGHRHMGDQPLAEKAALALEGPVDELIDEHEGARRQLLLERAARRQRYQIRHTSALQGIDIGTVIDVSGREPVAGAMAGQENDRKAVDLADAQRRRRFAPGTFDALLAHIGETRQIIDARSADNAQHGFGHALPNCRFRLPLYTNSIHHRIGQSRPGMRLGAPVRGFVISAPATNPRQNSPRSAPARRAPQVSPRHQDRADR